MQLKCFNDNKPSKINQNGISVYLAAIRSSKSSPAWIFFLAFTLRHRREAARFSSNSSIKQNYDHLYVLCNASLVLSISKMAWLCRLLFNSPIQTCTWEMPIIPQQAPISLEERVHAVIVCHLKKSSRIKHERK